MKTINIKGKEYVPVNERIKEFHKLYPNGRIVTEIVEHKDDAIVMKALVTPDVQDLNRFFTGYAMEKESSSFINKTSYVENAETSCVGRALGNLGLSIDESIASAEEVANAVNNQAHNKVDYEVLRIDEIKKQLDKCKTSTEVRGLYKGLIAKCKLQESNRVMLEEMCKTKAEELNEKE